MDPTFPTAASVTALGTSAEATHSGGQAGNVHALALGGPRRIGAYDLQGVLGSGGMGVVYRAEQFEPLRRTVALKLIRRGLDTDRLIARFETERLALARMSHSGIARVFDAGTSEDGRPYFVLELVDGPAITEFCDRTRASLRDRLLIFVAACRAVQHAHQKGIVHRDLKPSNILVTTAEGAPVPKIIDFGIAKALVADDDDARMLTSDGGVVGTAEYMSPEQAGVVAGDVDTRTDVYALGVVLYELLAGRKPHHFESATRDEIQRVLRTQTTVRPSTAVEPPRGRLRAATSAPPDASSWERIAEARQTTPERLRRQLAGDLDTIVLKAMAFDPARRYASVDQLAEDVERCLAGQPVLARPDSWGYRARKFVARHRVAVAAAAVLGLVLIGATAMTAVQSARVARERDRAEQALTRAEAVNRFLVGMFQQADPRFALGASLTAEQMLERASTQLQSDLRGQPDVRADLLFTLGGVYKQLGRYDLAEPLHTEAATLLRSLDTPKQLAEVLDQIGDVRRLQGNLAGAESVLEEALALRARTLGTRNYDYGESLNNLGLVLHARGRYAEAERLQREAVRTWEAVGAREPGDDLIALGLTNLARSVLAQGRAEEARGLLERGLRLRRASLVPGNPRVGTSLVLLGEARLALGDVEGALADTTEALRVREQALGPSHPQTSQARVQLAGILVRTGAWTQAREVADRALSLATADANTGPAVLAGAEAVLAEAHWRAGARETARRHLASARAHSARATTHIPRIRESLDRLAAEFDSAR